MTAPKFQRGDVVWCAMPSVGGTGETKRPALVIGDPIENVNHDYVLMQITSKPWKSRTDCILEESDPEFPQTGLTCTSTFRGHKVFVVTETAVQKRLGSVGQKTLASIEKAIKAALGLS